MRSMESYSRAAMEQGDASAGNDFAGHGEPSDPHRKRLATLGSSEAKQGRPDRESTLLWTTLDATSSQLLKRTSPTQFFVALDFQPALPMLDVGCDTGNLLPSFDS